ncbi:MAG: hypothetical protein IT235_01090 [Bacteroidia bacterium]|nr:hypothetical protein [Bacteroidia bacterium]
MRSYHSDKTIEGKLNNLFIDMEFHRAKGLDEMRDEALHKIKSLSKKYEQYEFGVKALQKKWQYKLDKIEEDSFIEHQKLIEKIVLVGKFRHLINLVNELRSTGIIRDTKVKQRWEKIVRDPIMKKEPSGHIEKHYYHEIYMAYYISKNNPEKSFFHTSALLKNFESHPELSNQNRHHYLGILVNLLIEQCKRKKLADAKSTMMKLLQTQELDLPVSDRKILMRFIVLSYSNLLSGLTSSGLFDEGLQIAKHSIGFITEKKPDTRFLPFLQFNLSIIYLYVGNYKEALKWNVSVLERPTHELRSDIAAMVRIINLILHYELDNSELLPYLIRSAYRYLLKKGKLFRIEKCILLFLRRELHKTNNKTDVYFAFRKLKVQMIGILKNKHEKNVLNYFDFVSWLDSKIHNRPLAEIVREKFNQSEAIK